MIIFVSNLVTLKVIQVVNLVGAIRYLWGKEDGAAFVPPFCCCRRSYSSLSHLTESLSLLSLSPHSQFGP